MSSFTVTLYIETNPLSMERVACGLLAVTPGKVFFNWSKPKVALAAKLAGRDYKGYFPEQFRMLKQGIELAHAERMAAGALFGEKSVLSAEYFSYIKSYNAGPTRFGEPLPHAGVIDQAQFDALFLRTIGDDPERHKASGSRIHRRFIKRLSAPELLQRADVNYLLPHERIHGLVISPKVDLITVNGSILMAQALDMTKSLGTIADHLYENEVIVRAMQAYGKQRKKGVEPMRIVLEPPVKGSEQEALLKRTRKEKSDLFAMVTLDEIEQEMNAVGDAKAKYQKFSEYVLE